jgi:hypothetical protein
MHSRTEHPELLLPHLNPRAFLETQSKSRRKSNNPSPSLLTHTRQHTCTVLLMRPTSSRRPFAPSPNKQPQTSKTKKNAVSRASGHRLQDLPFSAPARSITMPCARISPSTTRRQICTRRRDERAIAKRSSRRIFNVPCRRSQGPPGRNLTLPPDRRIDYASALLLPVRVSGPACMVGRGVRAVDGGVCAAYSSFFPIASGRGFVRGGGWIWLCV